MSLLSPTSSHAVSTAETLVSFLSVCVLGEVFLHEVLLWQREDIMKTRMALKFSKAHNREKLKL